jgi:hypothetical protein
MARVNTVALCLLRVITALVCRMLRLVHPKLPSLLQPQVSQVHIHLIVNNQLPPHVSTSQTQNPAA